MHDRRMNGARAMQEKHVRDFCRNIAQLNLRGDDDVDREESTGEVPS